MLIIYMDKSDGMETSKRRDCDFFHFLPPLARLMEWRPQKEGIATLFVFEQHRRCSQDDGMETSKRRDCDDFTNIRQPR